jgi:hypothetical protein
MADSRIDLDAARKLVSELSATLAALPPGSAKHAELRGEIEKLQNALNHPQGADSGIESQMRSAHSALDSAATELEADGIRVALFVSEIGRIIGLD